MRDMRFSKWLSGLTLAAIALSAGSARAAHGHGDHEESEYPLSYVERPMTLPRLTLAPQLELDVDRIGFAGRTGAVVVAGMQLGATFGITKDLEVGAVVLPVQFNQGAGYGGLFFGEEALLAEPSIFATYRFLHQHMIELGARLRMEFIVPRGGLSAGFFIEPSVPLLVHLGPRVRLDAEVGIPIGVVPSSTTGKAETAVGLDVPVRVSFDIIEPLHVGASTGVRIEDFGNPKESAVVPLGIFMGYAVGGKKPIVDIDPFFNFVDFITPGGGPFDQKVNPGVFVLGVSARGYIYF